jgi:cytochrome P450 family 4
VLLSKIPTLLSLPILDHALYFAFKSPAEILEFSLKLSRDLGRIAYISILGNPQIVTSDPKLSEIILSSTKFIEKSNFYDFFNKWLGTGLLTSGSRKWHERRKIITPAFHFKILEEFVEIFNKHGEILVEKLKNLNGKEIDVFHPVSLFAMDAICGKLNFLKNCTKL